MARDNAIKAVLFDFDGTLVFLPVDYDGMRSKLRQLFSRFGIESDFHPLVDSVEASLSKLAHISERSVKKTREEAYAIIEQEELKSVENAEPAPGAEEVLSILKNSNKRTAIVSRNSRRCINECLSRSGISKPDLIVGRDDANKLKPDPEHVNIALHGLKVKPSEAILVGDSYHDIVAGKRSNVRTVLVTNGKPYGGEEPKPNYEISTLLELLDICKQ